MFQKIEHIGIAVKSIEEAEQKYTKLLGVSSYKTEFVQSEQVTTVFFKTGDSKIELISAADPEHTINKFISKKGEGIHHVAYAVEDIQNELSRLLDGGFTIIGKPHRGADNKMICFLHPKDCNGVLTELCQEID